MRISDWSSDVCSSDLAQHRLTLFHQRDGHRPSPPSAQIIARAVNRVDDPYAFVAKPHQIVSRLFRYPGRARIHDHQPFPQQPGPEERREGKVCVSTGSYWWSPCLKKKKITSMH